VPRPEVCEDLKKTAVRPALKGSRFHICLMGLHISRHFVIAVCFFSAPGSHLPISLQNYMTASMHRVAEWMSGMLKITMMC